MGVLLVCTTKKCNSFGKVIIIATNFFCKVVQQQCGGQINKCYVAN